MIQTLSQLDEELALLLQHLDSESIEDRSMANSLLDELLPQLEQKIDSYMGVISHYGDKVANIDREIARLEVRKAIELGKQDYLKSVLQNWLELRSTQLGDKGKKVEGNLYKVSLVANGGKLPLKLNPDLAIDSIPANFTITSEVTKIDTDAIREFMTVNNIDSLSSPSGIIATLAPRGKHLRIT